MSSQDKNKPLNIYRASAGSGKTHLLTGFYIKQLFLTDLLPETHSGEMHFSEVLAVTFTNKATSEMKGRIIDELYLLSQNPKASHYWNDISQNGQKNEETIRKKANELLIQILNDYSSFNISTIDSFFQKIVRSFARELNVPGNYEVELDSNQATEAAVSGFLEKIDPIHSKTIFNWMVRFSDKRSEEGEGWDFRSKLQEMACKVLVSEAYRQHSQQIIDFTSDKKKLEEYEKMLHKIISEWREKLMQTGQEGLRLIEDYDIDKKEFFQSGSGTISHFNAWAKGEEKKPTGSRFNEVINDHNVLFKKTSVHYGSGIQETLVSLLESGLALFSDKAYSDYVTATVIQQDFYELGIIANIDEELRDYCNDHNVMLLSSTTELLSKLIGPYDAPFVYEKIGTHLKSYMIDEFQDTSEMQWHNFTPLVSNTLSEGYQNLIVGDVKQSIYRWRGSDWGLLDSGINRYEPSKHNDNDDELRTNWRSLPAIVEFNNLFFEYMSKYLGDKIESNHISRIYKDVRQDLPNSKTSTGALPGMVRIEFISPDKESEDATEELSAETTVDVIKRKLPLQIIALQQQGFKPKDIAILCRKKKECRLMAEILLQYKQEHPDCPYPMDIISSEALQMGSRPVIQTLISMMQLLQNPKSEIQQAVAWSNYLQLQGHTPEEAISIFFRMTKEERVLVPQIAFRPLYELTELLIAKLPSDVCEEEAPFLQAFRDIVLEFCHTHYADLSAFLEWWEQSGNTKAITTSEALNAIQIMTIHKSKGLGMPAVIVPYASWEMDIETKPAHRSIIWCEPKVEPFKKDILLPIKLDKKLTDTIFREDFSEERLRTVIDNLNTAYVAFTRAKEALVIMTPDTEVGKQGSRLENIIKQYSQELPKEGDITVSGTYNLPVVQTADTIEIGQCKRKEGSNDSDSPDSNAIPLNPSKDIMQNQLPDLSILHSPLQKDNTARKKGNYIHRVLQEIQDTIGYESIIHRLYNKGVIDDAIISENEMIEEIRKILSIPQVSSWFSPELHVMNEQGLIDAHGKQIRPDRIIYDSAGNATVIDYKTGNDHPGYRMQVNKYMNALEGLGFHHVKGYLFFLKDETIVEVKKWKGIAKS